MLLRPGAIHASHVSHAATADGESWSWLVLVALIVLGAVSGLLWAKAYDDDEEG